MFFFWIEPDLHNHLSLQLSSLKLIEAYVGSAPAYVFIYGIIWKWMDSTHSTHIFIKRT